MNVDTSLILFSAPEANDLSQQLSLYTQESLTMIMKYLDDNDLETSINTMLNQNIGTQEFEAGNNQKKKITKNVSFRKESHKPSITDEILGRSGIKSIASTVVKDLGERFGVKD